MKRQTMKSTESAASIRFDYVQAAKYYYFRAEGINESLTSTFNRMNAQKLKQRMDGLNIAVPTAEELHAAAAESWPEHKLHNF
jgi:hypothetical protein